MAISSPTQDFVVSSGLNVQGTGTVTSSTGNTSTLQVDGGAAIAKNVIVGGTAVIYGDTTIYGNLPFLTVTGTSTLATVTAGYTTATQLDVTTRLLVGGLSQLNNVTVTNPTNSTATTNGALVVTGGVGIGGNLYAGTIYSNGQQVLTSGTGGGFISSLTAGTDTAISSSTGAVTIWNTGTLQTVTGRGSTTTNAISITNTTSSTSTTTGALQVRGGVGIGGALWVNTTSFVNGSQILTTATISVFAASTLTAGTDTAVNTSTGAVTIWNTSTLQSVTNRGATTNNAITLSNTGASTVTNTANALYVQGGVWIDKTLNILGNITGVTATIIQVYGNSGQFFGDTSGFGALYAGIPTGFSVLPSTVFQTTARINDYAQNNFQNLNNGITASTDWVATSANGNDTSNYIDLGITSGTWDGTQSNSLGTALGQNDGYLYVQGSGTNYVGNLVIGTRNTGSQLKIVVGGYNSSAVVATFNSATTQSISTTTGAFTVRGGIGISGNIYVGNSATIASTIASTTTVASNALYVVGGVGVKGSLYVTGPAVFQDNVIFAGTTTYVLTTNTVYTDNIIELHYTSTWTVNDGKDIGLRFHYYDDQDRNAFFGRDNATGYLEWVGQAGDDTQNNVTGTNGTFRTGAIVLTSTTASSSTNTGALTVVGGVGIGGTLNVAGNTSFTSNVSVGGTNNTLTQLTVLGNATTATASLGLFNSGQYGYSGGQIYLGDQTYITGIATWQTAPGIGAIYDNAIHGGSPGGLGLYTDNGSNRTLRMSIDSYGLVKILSTTTQASASSTTTGALQVVGGAGIGGDLWVGGAIYANGQQVLTSGTGGGFVSSITAGTDTAVNTITGAVTIWNTGTLQSVTGRGATTTNAITISNTTSAISTNSGALQVVGSVGIGGALYVGTSSYINGALIITTATINQYASQTTITAGTDTAVNTSTGAIIIWNTSTLQSVTGRSSTTTNAITISNTTSAISTNSGALQVVGSVGIGGTLYVGGSTSSFIGNVGIGTVGPIWKVDANLGSIASGSISTGGYNVTGDATSSVGYTTYNMQLNNSTANASGYMRLARTASTVYLGMQIGSQSRDGIAFLTGAATPTEQMRISAAGIVTISTTTSSTSTTTGALTVTGGVGIGGKLFVGGLANNTSSYIAYYNTTTGELSFSTNPVQQTLVVANTSTASFFLTFVDSNNSTAQGEVFYTTSSFTINPATGNVTVGTTAASLSTSTSTGALQVRGGVGVSDSVYVGNRVGFVGTTQASVVYQFYNTLTNSLDTVFG